MADQEAVTFTPELDFELESKQVGENVYEVNQNKTESAPSQVPNSGSRESIGVDIGIFSITGWVDRRNKEIGITPTVLTIKATEYIFGLNSGLTVDMNLLAGRAKFKIGKEGEELIARLSFDGAWGLGSASETVTLYRF